MEKEHKIMMLAVLIVLIVVTSVVVSLIFTSNNSIVTNIAQYFQGMESIPFFIMYWIIAIAYTIFLIIATGWVYKDAKKRDYDNAGNWFCIMLLSGGFGLIIYLIVRKK